NARTRESRTLLSSSATSTRPDAMSLLHPRSTRIAGTSCMPGILGVHRKRGVRAVVGATKELRPKELRPKELRPKELRPKELRPKDPRGVCVVAHAPESRPS